jgi:hypothetical protein
VKVHELRDILRQFDPEAEVFMSVASEYYGCKIAHVQFVENGYHYSGEPDWTGVELSDF